MAKKILIVDDEEEIGESLKQELEDQGYEASCVSSGEKAIEKLKEQNWDMAIVDLKLSTKITGLDVLESILQEQPRTIMVALSGYEDIGMRQKVERLGARAFFRKPADIQIDVFHKKIKALFDRYGL